MNRRQAMVAALAMAMGLGLHHGPDGARAQSGAGRTELLMFDEKGCPWCRKWHAEVGPAYANSAEARRAPLRIVDLRTTPRPAGIQLSGPIRATPTFVLVENGREVGRIVGYGGEDFFWSMLGGLMKKLRGKAA